MKVLESDIVQLKNRNGKFYFCRKNISRIIYNREKKEYEIYFDDSESNKRRYSYKYINIINCHKTDENLSELLIQYDNKIYYNLTKLYESEKYYKIYYKSKDEVEKCNILEKEKRIKFIYKCDINDENIYNYFLELSKIVPESAIEKEIDEKKSYNDTYLHYTLKNDITCLDNSILYSYLYQIELDRQKSVIDNQNIYPFGFNQSQYLATINALDNRLSIIEGPPGTGKTQTILNILSNLVIQGKSVAVVSSNNEAIKNIFDKLSKNNLDFLVANLGRKEKREEFFDSQKKLSDLSSWEMISLSEEYDTLKDNEEKIKDLLNKEKKLKMLITKKEKYEIELKHLNLFLKNQEDIYLKKIDKYNFSSKQMLSIMRKVSMDFSEDKMISPLKNLLWMYRLGTSYHNVSNKINLIDLKFQKEYYICKIKEIDQDIEECNQFLKINNFQKIQNEYKEKSMRLYKAELCNKYKKVDAQHEFDLKDLTKHDTFINFLERYPIILSTTYSIHKCKPKNYLFDYIIVDEASQVDLLSALIAMSSCENMVIVGDSKQLPPIITSIYKKVNKPLIDGKNIKKCYDYTENSLLSSVKKLYPNIECTLLSEHYRCHSSIIGFCNKKYYNNELKIYSHVEQENALEIYRTVAGNHMRVDQQSGKFNYREIEVIDEEILPILKKFYKDDEIGIVAPYRKQVVKTQGVLNDEIEVDTVHKFQGREKKAIIISTVIDNTLQGQNGVKFVCDKQLVNVAVSRAIEKLILVTNTKALTMQENDIADLIYYIEYYGHNNAVKNSQIISVFDLLYKDYDKSLEGLNNNIVNKFKYKSENIIYTQLVEILSKKKYQGYALECHYKIHKLFKDLSILDDKQRKYISHKLTEVDFLIYKKIGNEPVMAIEVNGYYWHERLLHRAKKDAIKKDVFDKFGLRLLQLNTNESQDRFIEDNLDVAIIEMNERNNIVINEIE